jgi:hypothetical protein
MKFQATKILTLAAAWLVAAGPLLAAPNLTAIVVTGDPIPDGVGGFVSFSDFTETDINNSGQVAFTNSAGVFRWDGIGLTRIALQGETVPEANEVFNRFIRPDIDDTGRVGFITNPGSASGDGLALSSIVMTGQPVPSGNGTLFALLPQPFATHTTLALNDAGQSAFISFVLNTTDNTNGTGLFVREGASITTVAQEKLPLAGIDGVAQFLPRPFIPAINDAGLTAFIAGIDPTIGNNYSGVFIGDGISTTLIARELDPVPGSGVLTGFFPSSPTINNSGQAAFLAHIDDGSGNTASNFGLFIGDGTDLSLVAHVGGPAPDGGVFKQFAETPPINDAGQTAFWATIEEDLGDGTSVFSQGIFFDDGNSLTQIARTGQTIPDGTAVYELFRVYPNLNEAGQVVFQANLSGGERGIYLYDAIMGIVELVRTGDTLLDREILEINSSDSPSGSETRFNPLNNSGQVPFQFVLAGGQEGIAVVTIPEPGTLALMIAVGAAVIRRRRSREASADSV